MSAGARKAAHVSARSLSTVSSRDFAEYAGEILQSLHNMANQRGHTTLAGFLLLATAEAREIETGK